MKIAIVGAEESKWNENTKHAAEWWIWRILKDAMGGLLVIPKTNKRLEYKHEELQESKPLTLVSGRCPISICDNCGKRSFSKITDPIVGYVKCEFCGQTAKRRAGGIDISAEKIAIELEIKTEIYAPEINQWDDKYEVPKEALRVPLSQSAGDSYFNRTVRRKGFHSRNVDAINALNPKMDVLYCIEPKGRKRSGGLWTMRQAKKTGIRTFLIEVD